MINLKVNGKDLQVDVDPSTPIFWVLRDSLGPYRNKVWLWCGTMWRLHGSSGWGWHSIMYYLPYQEPHGKEIITIEGLDLKMQ